MKIPVKFQNNYNLANEKNHHEYSKFVFIFFKSALQSDRKFGIFSNCIKTETYKKITFFTKYFQDQLNDRNVLRSILHSV